MTADGLAGELPTGVILALCDRLLGEVGRRSHRFAWLRAPGAVADAWLPVEAYYPGHRLVVVCHSERTPYDHLFSELIPEHGLRLLQFSPADLGGEPGMAELKLSRMIGELPAPPGRAGDRQARDRRAAAPDRPRRLQGRGRAPEDVPETRRRRADAPDLRPRRAQAPEARPRSAAASEAADGAEAGARPAAASARTGRRKMMTAQAAAPAQPAERPRAPGVSSMSLPSFAGIPDRRDRLTAPRRARAPAARTRSTAPASAETVAVGVVAGVVLAAICGAELVAGVMAVTLSSGRVLLGLGIAFDACARALGALDAARAGKVGWAWSCAIIGSPAVVAAALSWRRGDIRIEAAPLAGLIGALAMLAIVVGLAA